MRYILTVFFGVFAVHATAADLLLKNVNIVDVESENIKTSDVLISNGLIAKIEEAGTLSCQCETYDLSGKYLIPGLNDMHTHAYGNISADGNQDAFMIEKASEKMLSVGVTSFLDLFYPEEEFFAFRAKSRTDQNYVGADVFGTGALLTCTGGHGTEYDVPVHIINTAEDAVREVTEHAKKSPDVVKIVYDHNEYAGRKMPTIDLKTITAAVHTANTLNLKTVIHVGTWDDVKDAIEAGATAVTHTPSRDMPQSIIELFHKYKTYWIPTLVVHNGLYGIVKDKSILDNELLKSVASMATLSGYMDYDKYQPWVKGWLEWQKKNEDAFFANFKKLQAANINIMTGTDIGNVGTFVGYSVHSEMQLMVKGGMTAWQALNAATVMPGKFLDRNHGMKPGALANLVVLNKSPIDDIGNTQGIHSVISHGRWSTR
jgi:imidazolonepropionase-like amidohydrolase